MSTRLKTLIISFVFLSLGLNIFLLGMMLGKKFDRSHHGFKDNPKRDEQSRKDFESLSKENKDKLNTFMKKTKDVFHSHHKEMKRLQKESFDLLIAEEFDVAAKWHGRDLPARPTFVGKTDQFRAEAHGKCSGANATPAPNEVVPHLMNKHEYGQNHQEGNYIVPDHRK